MTREFLQPAVLVLQDGATFEGVAVGCDGSAVGEVVFNTSMTGYQEILTDPSYAGQLVTLTAAHVGNYGTNPSDCESDGPKARGLIVRDMSAVASNHSSTQPLNEWLSERGVVAISGIDTRSLTRRIRESGVMMGIIAHGRTAADASALLEELRSEPPYGTRDWVTSVACTEPATARLTSDGKLTFAPYAGPDTSPHVVVLDFGVKYSIVRGLLRAGLGVTLVPPTSSAAVFEELGADAVLVSNGPGDPARMDGVLETLRESAQARPTWGICLGHQLLARAFGAQTFKLRYGHRGPNQPVQVLETGRVQMTAQNHGYAVAGEDLPEGLEVTHRNLNDGTVEGFRHRVLPVAAVQHHPEAGPGPNDAATFFREFADVLGVTT